VLFDYVKVNRFEAKSDDWIDIVIENINMEKIVPDIMIKEMAKSLDEVMTMTWDQAVNFKYIKQELSTFNMEMVMKDKVLMARVSEVLTRTQKEHNGLMGIIPHLK
jgi:hypothetical protein